MHNWTAPFLLGFLNVKYRVAGRRPGRPQDEGQRGRLAVGQDVSRMRAARLTGRRQESSPEAVARVTGRRPGRPQRGRSELTSRRVPRRGAWREG